MAVYNEPNIQRLAGIVRSELGVRPSPPLAGTAGPARSDSVALSLEAKVLAAVKQQMGQGALVRTDKVEALKKAIADGTYKVPAEKIAEAILREGRLLKS